eukprot:GHVR01025777.1.p1 GENE.GHVR01025777.1~~GHVR01025777.1.p1  ORF type:complete len:233 (+),score=52.61 GHVR01025777.1:280-978(+)
MLQEYEKAELVCEEGYEPCAAIDPDTWMIHRCWSKERVEPVITCPLGFDQQGRDCVFEGPVAPIGQPLPTGGTSIAYTRGGMVVCPVGASVTHEGSGCVHKEVRPLVRSCPEPFEPVGSPSKGKTCHRKSSLPPYYACPKDFHLIDGGAQSCVRYTGDPNKKYCPHGFDYVYAESEGLMDYCVRYAYDDQVPLCQECQYTPISYTVTPKYVIPETAVELEGLFPMLTSIYDS